MGSFTADEVRALGGPDWLRAARLDALERFAGLDLPTTEAEVWRYSRVDELDLDRFVPAPPVSDQALVEAARAAASGAEVAGLVVTVNGRVAHTEIAESAAGLLAVSSLADAPHGRDAWDALRLGDDAFHALAAAFRPDAIRVRVAPGAELAGPVVVVHLVTSGGGQVQPPGVGTTGARTDRPVAVFPAVALEVGERASVSCVELVRSSEDELLVMPVTRLELAREARLGYVTVQELGASTWQVGHQRSVVAADARLVSFTLALGGDYARARVDSSLEGPGGSSELLAAYYGRDGQVLDFRTQQIHAAPHTTSDLLFKGAVSGASRSVYTGLIQVRRGAKGTNAFQTNRNLVLSPDAHADSVPNLDIAENDVRCSHASAVGPIDPEQRYYLESRGIPPAEADRLIVLGFFDDILGRLPVSALRPAARESLAARAGLATSRTHPDHDSTVHDSTVQDSTVQDSTVQDRPGGDERPRGAPGDEPGGTAVALEGRAGPWFAPVEPEAGNGR